MDFTPANLGVTFPTNFNIDPEKVSISIALTTKNRLFKSLDYNSIQSLVSNVSEVDGVRISSYPTFTVDGQTILMTGIASQVDRKNWTYLFVSNVQNPSSYQRADFTIAYYLISNGFSALEWEFQAPLTYQISPAPKFISINSVVVSDLDVAYPARYSFTFSSTDSYVGQ